jgi:hypothetical protein
MNPSILDFPVDREPLLDIDHLSSIIIKVLAHLEATKVT